MQGHKRTGDMPNPHPDCLHCDAAREAVDRIMVENGRLRVENMELKRQLRRGYVGSDKRPLALPRELQSMQPNAGLTTEERRLREIL